MNVLHRCSEGLNDFLPNPLRRIAKRIYYRMLHAYSTHRYVQQGKFSDIGYRFRFTRVAPNFARIGDKTGIDDFNVWSCKLGNIIVGDSCWFGLHNTIMGPVVIGDKLLTGPYVSILGPHHAIHNYEHEEGKQTVIGNNVWISTGSVILFGVNVGDNAIIGPGSVVMKDVPKNAYVAGNPARDLTRLTNFQDTIENLERFPDSRPT